MGLRTPGQFLFLPNNIFECPPRVGSACQKWNIKVVRIRCTLNLCLGTPGPTQNESRQSDHPVQRKHPKRAEIFAFFDDGLKQ